MHTFVPTGLTRWQETVTRERNAKIWSAAILLTFGTAGTFTVFLTATSTPTLLFGLVIGLATGIGTTLVIKERPRLAPVLDLHLVYEFVVALDTCGYIPTGHPNANDFFRTGVPVQHRDGHTATAHATQDGATVTLTFTQRPVLVA